MRAPPSSRPPVRLYAAATRAFPHRVRALYGAEMITAFAASWADQRRRSARQARRYTRRALSDALITGARERYGSGGIGGQPPRTPVAAWIAGKIELLFRELGSDLRFAFRTLRRSPAFTIAVLAVLALSLGINGAIFTAIKATLLAPLPYPEPDELVILDYTLLEDDRPGPPRAMGWAWPKYRVLADAADTPFEATAAYAVRDLTLAARGNATRLQAEVVTPGYFPLLGVEPGLGRSLSGAGRGPSDREVILSHSLWRERFGADKAVLGERVILNGEPLTVVGVGPQGFRGLSGVANVWISIESGAALILPSLVTSPQIHWLQAIARLADGASRDQARDRMGSIAVNIEDSYPFGEPGTRVGGSARGLAEARRNPRAVLAVGVVAAAAGLVLLIGCANLAGLLLARGSERRREIAVRLAIGGSRARVARSLITEHLLLAGAGALLGLGVAATFIKIIVATWPVAFSSGGWNLAFVDATSFGLDGSAIAYTLGLGLLAGLLFGTGPALSLTRSDLGVALRHGVVPGSRDRGRTGPGRWIPVARPSLVAIQVGAALVLLVGAGLMISSLWRLLDVETGIDAEQVLVFEYSLPRGSTYAADPASFHQRLLADIRRLPRVEAAAGGVAPLRSHWSITRMLRAGGRSWDTGEAAGIGVQSVTDDYFRTLGIPLLRGRAFAPTDGAGSAPVIIINQYAATAFFGEADPVGQPLAIAYGITADGTPAEVIGVVGDALYDSRENGTMPEAYFLQAQNPEGDLQIMVRTRGAPLDIVPDVRAAVAAIDPSLPIQGITTAATLASIQVSDTRVVMQLLAAFAAMAALQAAIGIWGVVSYSVVRRRRELGIRMALGARTGQALGLVLRHGLASALIGLGVGTVTAAGLARYMSSLLYEVEPSDPRAFLGAAAMLLAVALLAAWLPALRATRVDPAETLRVE